MSHRAFAGVGSRKTPEPILERMHALGSALARRGLILRSGAAPGADTAFEDGARAAGGACEIYLPWKGFEKHPTGVDAESLKAFHQAYSIASKLHRGWAGLSRPVRLLMTRNVFQVLGADLDTPSKFVVCWAPNPRLDRQGRVSNVDGGTGLAVRLAHARGIPVFHWAVPAHNQRLQAYLKAAA